MEIVPTNYTVADYCVALQRNEIQVDRKYQRSDKVWPLAARSFLIETILLGFPVPKLSLFQRLEVKTKSTYKEIVDGQQRSSAILDFYEDKIRLSKKLDTSDVAGKTYSTLPDEYKERFLNYRLATDVFVAASPEMIREVFRRINSYTVPLNPEEERHATFQGDFKWFVYRLSKSYDSVLLRVGVFGEKQFVRMADTKLYTEILHALLNGIRTTNKPALDAMYRNFNVEFDREEEFADRFKQCLARLDGWDELHRGALMKPYIVYALILALTHVSRPVSALATIWPASDETQIDERESVQRLSELADVLDNQEKHKGNKFASFVSACTSKTNVASQREERFRWFCRALVGEI